MAVTYGFYNSLEGDRKYTAEQMGAMFDGLIEDGVFARWGNTLQVVSNANTNMQVVVRSGKAWFMGTWTINDRDLLLTVPAANALQPRRDAVVLEVDKRSNVRANQIFVAQGIANSNPQPPVMIDTDERKWFPLAYITLTPGLTKITDANIQNLVGTQTPFVTGLLEQVSAETLYSQWDNQFNTWFSDIQGQMTGDIATNLQKQITDLKTTVSNLKTIEKASGTDLTSYPDTEKYVNPAGVKQVVTQLALTDSKKASSTEAITGTDNTKYITPYTLKKVLDNGGGSSGGSGFTLTQGSITITTNEEVWPSAQYGNAQVYEPPEDLIVGTGLKWSSNSIIRIVPRTKFTAMFQVCNGITFLPQSSGSGIGSMYVYSQLDPGSYLNLAWDVYILTPN